jgi:hypothetical protein
MHSLLPLASSALPCRLIPSPPCFAGGAAYFDGTKLENVLRCVSMAATDRDASAAAEAVMPTFRRFPPSMPSASPSLTAPLSLAVAVLIYRAASGLKSSERCP